MSSENRHLSMVMDLELYFLRLQQEPELFSKISDKYVSVRTQMGNREIIGWVERKRLASLITATQQAAYLGYTYIPDPDHQDFGIIVSGSGCELPNNVQQAFREVYNDMHEKHGKRPGEIMPSGTSYDKAATLIALFEGM